MGRTMSQARLLVNTIALVAAPTELGSQSITARSTSSKASSKSSGLSAKMSSMVILLQMCDWFVTLKDRLHLGQFHMGVNF